MTIRICTYVKAVKMNQTRHIFLMMMLGIASAALIVGTCDSEEVRDLPLKLDQVEGSLTAAALRLGYPMQFVIKQPCLPEYAECHYDAGFDVTIGVLMLERPKVHQLEVSTDSGHAEFRGVETFERFQQVCAVIVSAVRKSWPKSKIQKIAGDMAVQLDASEGKCIKEDGLEFYGDRYTHEFTTDPGKAYYTCGVVPNISNPCN